MVAEDTTEQLKRAIEQNPRRWLPEYDAEGKLDTVVDADSGRVWFRIEKEGWGWVD